MKKTILTTTLLLIANLSFAIELNDPNNLLPLIDIYTQELSFEESFKCEDRSLVKEYSCLNLEEQTTCSQELTYKEVTTCSYNQASIKSISANSTYIDVFNRSQYEEANGNIFRYIELGDSSLTNSFFIKGEELSLTQDGEVTISSLTLQNTEIKSEIYLGKNREILVIRFDLKVCQNNTNECFNFSNIMEITKNVPYLAQIKSYRWDIGFAKGTQEVTKFTRK